MRFCRIYWECMRNNHLGYTIDKYLERNQITGLTGKIIDISGYFD